MDEQNIQEFQTLLTEFVSFLQGEFPSCSEVNLLALQVDTLVTMADRDFMNEILTDWLEHLSTPLAGAKYKKPVARLMLAAGESSRVCVHHAVAYGDVDTLMQYPNKMFEMLHLNEKIRDPQFSPGSRAETLRYICRLSNIVYLILDKPKPLVPSREQIAEEIARHKASKQQLQPVQTQHNDAAFFTALLGLVDACEHQGGDATRLALVRKRIESEPDAVLAEWMQTMQTPVQGRSLEEFLQAGHFDRLGEFPLTGICADMDLHGVLTAQHEDTAKIISMVLQSNVLFRIHQSVPTQMRNCIEGTAQRIAAEILNGNTSFDDLDLSAIGQEVMGQCQAEDLSSLADNLGSLLPMLQSQMVHMPAIMESMQAMNNIN